jgi:mRNA interferase RelE/StbE
LGLSASQRIREKLRGHVYPVLVQNPWFGPNIKRLRRLEPSTWRYRVGQWRFFYTIDEEQNTVFMLVADNRSSAYR